MLALILAGGKGTRLSLGEKPLVTICGRPMIAYVIEAFVAFGCEVAVATSPHTPYTGNWCRAHGILEVKSRGRGYVEDLVEAAGTLDGSGPLFTSVADLPCLASEILDEIFDGYVRSGRPACSAWIPREICRKLDCRTRYVEVVDGVAACPVGINVLQFEAIEEPQDEKRLLVPDRRLAFNINTREEREVVERYLCHRRGP